MEKRIITYLMVEDDESLRKDFLAYSAAHEEFICLDMVDNVEDAVDRTRKLRPQAVILDLQLSECDGEDYLVRIKKLNLKEEDRPFVLVLTNISDPLAHAEANSLGAYRTLWKIGSRYQDDGPGFVHKFIEQRRHLLKVKLDPLHASPAPYETKEALISRIRNFCYEYAAKRDKYTEYGVYTIAAIKAHGSKRFQILSLIQDKVSPDFDGAAAHAIYVGAVRCVAGMWDHGLQREYETRYATDPNEGMPKPLHLLKYLAEQF